MRREVALVLASIDDRILFHDFRMVRGETHTNLIFDMSLPDGLLGQEEQIHAQLDTAINLRSKTTYHTVINFESMAFNDAEVWEGE